MYNDLPCKFDEDPQTVLKDVLHTSICHPNANAVVAAKTNKIWAKKQTFPLPSLVWGWNEGINIISDSEILLLGLILIIIAVKHSSFNIMF